MMRSTPQLLSRTSSHTSVDSVEDVSCAISAPAATRRTRKRFSNIQLMMLEHLFHKTSHPTRDEREQVAREAMMEIKSVTIWFQNKRQTERKVALHNANSANENHVPSSRSSPFTSAPSVNRSILHRPALEKTRSDLRVPPSRNSYQRHHPTAWDNVSSSPLAPPMHSPLEYDDYPVTHPRQRRTLEWACATSRRPLNDGRHSRSRSRDGEEETDEESHEAVTPCASVSNDTTPRRSWSNEPVEHRTSIKELSQDDDIMKAALALCGLGRR